MSAALDDTPRLSTSPAVAMALQLVAAGYHVAPVTVRPNPLTGRKMPSYHGKWATISTTDPEQVHDWAAEHGPGLGFCIDCTASGIVVIDLDVKPGHVDDNGRHVPAVDAVADWARAGMPIAGERGMVVDTPTGGVHCYWRQRPGEHVVNSQGKIATGVDVRGDGGHVFAPGTAIVGESGAIWRLTGPVVPAAELDQLPDVIYGAIPGRERRRERDVAYAQGAEHDRPWIERLLASQARLVAEHDARPGSGFRPVLRGAAMVHGRAVAAGIVTRDEAEQALADAVTKAWQAPPDEQDHEWIDTGIDDGIADPWTIVEPRDTKDEGAGGAGDTSGDDADEQDAPSSWAPIDLGPILDGTAVRTLPTILRRVDPATGAVAHAFYPGLTHSLHGESESGKSWVAQHAVIEVLAGGGRALIVDFESSADQIVPRLRALGLAREHVDRLVYVNPDTGADKTFFREILRQRFDVAIVDGVTASIAAWGGNSNSQDDVSTWHRELPERLARRTGAAVVQIDHVSKATEGRGRMAIGSQAKMATLTGSGFYVDVGAQLAPGSVGEIRLSVGKDRPGDVRRHAGERGRDRLQPWARVVFDARNPDALVLKVEPWDGQAGEDEPDDVAFAGADTAPWQSVVVPDAVSERVKRGRGHGVAIDLIRIMYRSHTDEGLTEAAIRSQWCESGRGGKNPRARAGAAWALLDASLVLAHGSGGAARWVLDPGLKAMIDNANPA